MKFVRPVNTHGKPAKVSNTYSWYHKGIDYAYPEGETIFASETGYVLRIVSSYKNCWRNLLKLTTADYGNFIIIQHHYGYQTYYTHLRPGTILVKQGQQVSKGQPIAQEGKTGNTGCGAHLHYELRQYNKQVNPIPLMDLKFTGYK